MKSLNNSSAWQDTHTHGISFPFNLFPLCGNHMLNGLYGTSYLCTRGCLCRVSASPRRCTKRLFPSVWVLLLLLLHRRMGPYFFVQKTISSVCWGHTFVCAATFRLERRQKKEEQKKKRGRAYCHARWWVPRAAGNPMERLFYITGTLFFLFFLSFFLLFLTSGRESLLKPWRAPPCYLLPLWFSPHSINYPHTNGGAPVFERVTQLNKLGLEHNKRGFISKEEITSSAISWPFEFQIPSYSLVE